MTIRPELIDELLKECADPKELLAEGGFLRQLTSALIGRCLETEMEEHLGYPKHGKRSEAKGNARIGGPVPDCLRGLSGVLDYFDFQFRCIRFSDWCHFFFSHIQTSQLFVLLYGVSIV
ncbi:hypothetical protein ccbrp13_31760 [Ktedonobacteria bacterium brp13]|nr:hypothetical protein ccbrp13_31760 [Ktedonobacteria bacterium brp13]